MNTLEVSIFYGWDELQMLQASQKILNSFSVIHIEVNLKDTYKGAVPYIEYKECLELKGFKMAIEALPAGTDIFVRK